jgi:hypothetical protein
MLRKMNVTTLSVVLMLTMVLQLLLISSAQAATTGSVIYSNVDEPEPYYTRAVKLSNGDILTTFTRKFPVSSGFVGGMQPFNFYRSTDNGKTWSYYNQIDPNDYGLNRDKQAMTTLYVLPRKLGIYPAGTLLFASSDWNADSTYTIHIWRSTDNGATWQLHSNLAPRGTNPRSVWEPEFAVSSDGRLICFYSDERQGDVTTEEGYNQSDLSRNFQ